MGRREHGRRHEAPGQEVRGPVGIACKKLVPFSEFADAYLELKGSGPKPKRSIRSIRGYINHLKAFFGDRPLARITVEMVEAYRDKRSEDAARPSDPERKMKGESINRELATLRNIFSTARKEGPVRRQQSCLGCGVLPGAPEGPQDP